MAPPVLTGVARPAHAPHALRATRAPHTTRVRVAVALALAITTAGLVLLYVRDPNVPGNYPPCPTFALAHIRCPGCGTLRALHALMHLDLGTAWDDNPLAVLALPLMLWMFASLGLVVLRGRGWRTPPLPRRAPEVVLALLVLYTVLRNV